MASPYVNGFSAVPARQSGGLSDRGGRGQAVLQELLATSLILAEDWEALAPTVREELLCCPETAVLLSRLVAQRLLTEYQAERVREKGTFGLRLGSYRVLNLLGSGGMSQVYLAEHIRLRRQAAIKVLSSDGAELLSRFCTEMKTIAQLRHPNIVTALDAGQVARPDGTGSMLHYFVMEYVPGQDLRERVEQEGELPIAAACGLMHQVAAALVEVHRHHLVHRDIKPANVLVTPDGQAKLLDFGLARHFLHHQTEFGTLLGTIDYMAPEQAQNPTAIDIRADLYGLGGTLFWCLTGRRPYPLKTNPAYDPAQQQGPVQVPSVRSYRKDVPAELDSVVARLLAPVPDDRYPTPQAVMRALLPFLSSEAGESALAAAAAVPAAATPTAVVTAPRVHHVLLVDDDPQLRKFCRFVLQAEDVVCDEVDDGRKALEILLKKPYDLVILDVELPGMTGPRVLERLRADPPSPHLKVLVCSGSATPDDMARLLAAGADDYLAKPMSDVQLQARARAALRLKDAQDRSDRLTRHLLTVNHQMEQHLTARDSDLVHARNALVLALPGLVAHRDTESGSHLSRLQRYVRTLAEAAAASPALTEQIDQQFIQMLECCVPLHDIGKVGLPDAILLARGKLNEEERFLMQAHTVMGAETLQKVARRHGFALPYLQMAIDITRHHHERYDGNGYPDRLAGRDIPLAARVVAVCDVYDALRSRRPYRPKLPHRMAVQVVTEGSGGHFDPLLVKAFQSCATQFERIYEELPDEPDRP